MVATSRSAWKPARKSGDSPSRRWREDIGSRRAGARLRSILPGTRFGGRWSVGSRPGPRHSPCPSWTCHHGRIGHRRACLGCGHRGPWSCCPVRCRFLHPAHAHAGQPTARVRGLNRLATSPESSLGWPTGLPSISDAPAAFPEVRLPIIARVLAGRRLVLVHATSPSVSRPAAATASDRSTGTRPSTRPAPSRRRH